MSVRLPVYLVIVQWAALLALGALVMILFRQLAYLLDLSRAVAHPDSEAGLRVGEVAPSFRYVALGGDHQDRANLEFDPGVPTLLLFTDPRCSTCEAAVAAVRDVNSARESPVRLLAVTDASPEMVAHTSLVQYPDVQVAQVDSNVTVNRYRVSVTPLANAVDVHGVIVGRATRFDKETVEGLLELLDHSVTEGVA